VVNDVAEAQAGIMHKFWEFRTCAALAGSKVVSLNRRFHLLGEWTSDNRHATMKFPDRSWAADRS
jgi:hypothetical protein